MKIHCLQPKVHLYQLRDDPALGNDQKTGGDNYRGQTMIERGSFFL
jgi:hypothetical protein